MEGVAPVRRAIARWRENRSALPGVRERAEEKGTKAAFLAVDGLKQLLLHELGEKTLRAVGGLLGGFPAMMLSLNR